MEEYLPSFALFKSDRASSDGDSEVQGPLKAAVQAAVKEYKDALDSVAANVRAKVLEAAGKTVEKMVEMDSRLDGLELIPEFENLKWDSVFKVTLTGKDNVPLNKRGSGFRRLVLLNFFRAEAEKTLLSARKKSSIIYAIEEPETSQHPSNQRMLFKAFQDLTEKGNSQVILTTHNPQIAGLLPLEGLRYLAGIGDDGKLQVVNKCDEKTLDAMANALGIVPDARRVGGQSVKLLVCLEGVNDVAFWFGLSAILNRVDAAKYPCLETSPYVVVLGMGGGNLQHWVEYNYLKKLGLPEAHFYDRDLGDQTKHYDKMCELVRNRKDKSTAKRTKKREIENYIHIDAITPEYSFNVTKNWGDDDDVAMCLAEQWHANQKNQQVSWQNMKHKGRKRKAEDQKYTLCHKAVRRMTVKMLDEMDADGELKGWLQQIGEYINAGKPV